MLIAFGHRKAVGKDLTARLLQESGLFKEINVISFAEIMKDKAYELFADLGLQLPNHYEIFRDEKEQMLPLIHKTPRELYIEYGMAIREIWPNVWIHHAMTQVIPDPSVLNIFTDLRFENEFRAIKDAGGHCIRIDRDSVPITDDEADVALSWLPDANWDAIMYNNGDKNDLARNVLRCVKELCKDTHIYSPVADCPNCQKK